MEPPLVQAPLAGLRSDSLGSDSRQRSAPFPSGAVGVVIRDGPRDTSSGPIRRSTPIKKEVKKEAPGSLLCGRIHLRPRKEEDVTLLPPPGKKCWEMELQAQAAYCGPNEPEDAPGQQLLLGRPVDEDYRQLSYDEREVELWSTMDYGNYVDLAGGAPSPPPAPKEDEDNWEASDDDNNGGDGADSGDYSAFDR